MRLTLCQGISWFFGSFSLDDIFHISCTSICLVSILILLLCLLFSLFASTAEISLKRPLLLCSIFGRVLGCSNLSVCLVSTLMLLSTLLLLKRFGCWWWFQIILILSSIKFQSCIYLFTDIEAGVQIAWLHVSIFLWILMPLAPLCSWYITRIGILLQWIHLV